MQNLENMRVTADTTLLRPGLELGRVLHLERGLEPTPSRVRLSKIETYLVDNLSYRIVSHLEHAVNDNARCGTEGSGNIPRSRKPARSWGAPSITTR